MISFSSSHCPFPPSLWRLKLHGAGGMGTLLPLLNLISLIELTLSDCGEDLRSDGLWHLVAQGQLRYLKVKGSPRFFLGSDPVGELQDEYQNHLLRHSSKLMVLETDGFGFLATPVCSILSSSLIVLHVESDNESERFTKEQEEAFQLLTSLQRLDFTLCEKLQCLPAGLHRLPNLKVLKIIFCSAINSLPEDGLPSSLEQLHVTELNMELLEQCRRYVQSHPQIQLT